MPRRAATGRLFFGVTEIARLVAASARAPIPCDDPIASNVQFFSLVRRKSILESLMNETPEYRHDVRSDRKLEIN